jgi:hypothetical protein
VRGDGHDYDVEILRVFTRVSDPIAAVAAHLEKGGFVRWKSHLGAAYDAEFRIGDRTVLVASPKTLPEVIRPINATGGAVLRRWSPLPPDEIVLTVLKLDTDDMCWFPREGSAA